MAEIDAEVDRDLDPFRQAVRLLRTIPGVSDLTAQVIVSEIGVDMGRFPTAGHLISWAGLCPRNDESAGKRRSSRLRKGATWLKTYHMLRDGTFYQDLGAEHFGRISPETQAKRLAHQIARLG